MSKIQVSAKMKIPEGMLEEFKVQVTECIRQVKEKDHGTLQYDWFLCCDNSECEIREAYESSDAALLHQSNLSEQLRILFEKFGSVHSVVIYGDPSAELLENVKSSGIETVIFSFLKGLNHINE
jgi:quinol monooxygenase YgiN